MGSESLPAEAHPTCEEIELRAYEIYIECGCADWLQAGTRVVLEIPQNRADGESGALIRLPGFLLGKSISPERLLTVKQICKPGFGGGFATLSVFSLLYASRVDTLTVVVDIMHHTRTSCESGHRLRSRHTRHAARKPTNFFSLDTEPEPPGSECWLHPC